ncbi:MAG: FadD3 family acyl-CoA ligase [Halieaceae bacterium]|nr:FadD3 family acyl-CoA ligase [Halieaceae bacterium]
MLNTSPRTTIELIYRAAERYQDRPFLEENGTQISFTEFKQACLETAAGLKQLDFKPGDRAAIWAPNISEWVIAAFGAHFAGGQIVTLNTRYKGEEAAAILNDSRASTLFVMGQFLGNDYLGMIANLELPHLKHRVQLKGEAQASATKQWSDLQEQGQAWIAEHGTEAIEQDALAISGDAISDIMFTSGTTGRAKGVLCGHQQNVQAFTTFSEILGLDNTDRYLIINPFFHSFGFKAGLLACLSQGCTVLPEAVFDVDKILERIDNEQITVMPGPPTIFQSILAHPNRSKYSLSSLTKCTTGAAVIPTELIVAMRDELKISTIITAYGLSESCGLATMCRQGDAPDIIAKTSGRAIPGVDVRCVDEQGNEVARGEQGEIVIRGFNVMQGYLDNPEATLETIDADGWLHTGDVGRMDEAGNLTITDRLKDMYISGGFNCYPAEIESTLLRHADVVQAAVIGYPDERMGEVGWAFVTLKTGSAVTADQISTWARDNMANYKAPKKLVIVDALPLNASGKVVKPTLRQGALDGTFK